MAVAYEGSFFIHCERGAEAPLHPCSLDYTNSENGLAATAYH